MLQQNHVFYRLYVIALISALGVEKYNRRRIQESGEDTEILIEALSSDKKLLINFVTRSN